MEHAIMLINYNTNAICERMWTRMFYIGLKTIKQFNNGRLMYSRII